MATTPRNIRFDDDLYKEIKAISKRPLTAAYHIQEACRQYLESKAEPVNLDSSTIPAFVKPKPVKPKKPTGFNPPSQQEAGNYFLERGSTDALNEADKFSDFYASKNWMVGKNKMKDWKAAIRNWMRKSNEQQQRSNQPSQKQLIGQALHGSTADNW